MNQTSSGFPELVFRCDLLLWISYKQILGCQILFGFIENRTMIDHPHDSCYPFLLALMAPLHPVKAVTNGAALFRQCFSVSCYNRFGRKFRCGGEVDGYRCSRIHDWRHKARSSGRSWSKVGGSLSCGLVGNGAAAGQKDSRKQNNS